MPRLRGFDRFLRPPAGKRYRPASETVSGRRGIDNRPVVHRPPPSTCPAKRHRNRTMLPGLQELSIRPSPQGIRAIQTAFVRFRRVRERKADLPSIARTINRMPAKTRRRRTAAARTSGRAQPAGNGSWYRKGKTARAMLSRGDCQRFEQFRPPCGSKDPISVMAEKIDQVVGPRERIQDIAGSRARSIRLAGGRGCPAQ